MLGFQDMPAFDPEICFQDLSNFICSHLSDAENNVSIFSPFISLPALNQIMAVASEDFRVEVITRWQTLDFILGSASLELFDLCATKGWSLYFNPRLHLKTVLFDYQSLILGSANITGRGLGLKHPSNYEVLSHIRDPSRSYLLYLEQIKSESALVTDEVVAQLRQALDALEIHLPIDHNQLSVVVEELYQSAKHRNFFLISELPLCKDISSLYQATINPEINLDAETLATARHDIIKYSLLSKSYQSEANFRVFLTQKFFSHPFIQAVCFFIDRPRRFGEVRAWVQENCTDVPVPTRRSLSDNVNVLYNWLVELGQDRFITYRPNHTEMIAPKEWVQS